MRLTRRLVRAVGNGLLSRREAERLAQVQASDAGYGFDMFGMQRDWLLMMRALLGPLYKYYFRVSAFGTEHIPKTGAAILVSNHAGTFPLDATMICLDVAKHTEPARMPRVIVDRFVPKIPFVGATFSRLGAVSGTHGNVRALLESGELCLIFPEGLPAIGKPRRERYALRDFRVGYAELAMRHGVPVVPLAVIGSEEQWPQIGRIKGLGVLGAPYVPIVATPLPLPVHYRIHYGAPLDLRRFASDGPLTSEAIARANQATRAAVEALVAKGLAERRGVFL